MDRVWGEDRPPSSRNVLYSYLSRLRRCLAGAPGVRIERRHGGYAIAADASTIDLHRFRQGLARVQQPDAVALQEYESALAQWRGTPFGTIESHWLAGVRTRLAAERLAGELDRNEVALRLGEHAGLAVRLTELAASYPLDERVAGQLALSLHSVGRAADALAKIKRTRRRLAEELGIDPGARLRDVELTILRRDDAGGQPALPVRRSVPSGTRGAAGRRFGGGRGACGAVVQLPSGRRMLILVDGAAAEGQVRLLLPGGRGCDVVITSRSRLTGLPGVRLVELDVMSATDSTTFLIKMIGAERAHAELTALERIGAVSRVAARIAHCRSPPGQPCPVALGAARRPAGR